MVAMATSADGTQVVTGTGDKDGAEKTWKEVRTFSLLDGRLLRSPLSNLPKIGEQNALAYLKSGAYLFIGTLLNRTLYICDTATGAIVDTVGAHGVSWAIASHPTNDRFAAASGADIIVWSVL